MLLLGWLFEKPKSVLSSVDVACLIATLFLSTSQCLEREGGEIMVHILSLSIDWGAFMQIMFLVKLLTCFHLEENRTSVSGHPSCVLGRAWQLVVQKVRIAILLRVVTWFKSMQREAFLCQKKCPHLGCALTGTCLPLPPHPFYVVHFLRGGLECPPPLPFKADV